MKRLKIYSAFCLVTILLAIGSHMWLSPPNPEAVKDGAREVGIMDFRAYDKDGNLIWKELARENNLADEGEYMFLNVVLKNGTAPAGFYLRLYNTTPVETSTLSAISATEPATTYAYAAQALTRDGTGWPTLELDSNDYQATSATKTFQATGGPWGPVTYCVLADVTHANDATGKLISFVALSTSRTLADGESLQVTYKLKQQ